jgi:hypothetical protein
MREKGKGAGRFKTGGRTAQIDWLAAMKKRHDDEGTAQTEGEGVIAE